jgi:hypothetical protein
MVTRRDKGMETMETKRCWRQCVTSKRVDKAIALSSSRGVSYEILYERGCVWAHYRSSYLRYMRGMQGVVL